MSTLEIVVNPFEERKRYKVDDDEPFTYFDASKTGDITYFKAFVEKYSLSNPENLPRLEGIEEALFHSYPDDMMFMNEGFYMILISQGFKFNNDLFALLVLGSIYDFIGKNCIDKNAKLKDCFDHYQNLDVIIKDEENLIIKSQSFVHYMYDNESNNQEPYQFALEGIPCTIHSFRTSNGKLLFPKFKYFI